MEDNFDELRLDLIQKELAESIFGRKILYHESLDSTNTLAKELAAQGAPEGTLVLADEQRAGRGRRGRAWLSPPGANLLFSVILRPDMNPERVFVLTMILALAAADGVEAVSGQGPVIKWPNDLYLQEKKLAGILTEFSLRKRSIEYVVLGLGLNVNWNPAEGDEIANPATSLLAASGHHTDRNELLVRILGFLERYYRDVLSGRMDSYHKRWNDLSLILGREIAVESEKEKIYGRAIRIDEVGALIMEDEKGRQHRIISGEVSVRLKEP
ncbi:MAG: biotin--[acetyl-CoA-carboxylase] ligase [Pseudomonadota bacterium]